MKFLYILPFLKRMNSFQKVDLKVKVLFISDEDGERILHYHIIENETEKVLDFALDEEEEAEIFNYCKELIAKQY